MLNINKKSVIEITMTIIMAVVMVGTSEILSEREIIFPEIMALAVGSFIAPSFAWNVSKLKMLVMISLCAVIGVLIVIFLPVTLWLQISLAFFIVQIIYLYSRTTFAPVISAMVLPVLLQTKSIVYPIAAVVLTALIVLVLLLLEKTGVREKKEYTPLPMPAKKEFADMLIRVGCVLVLAFAAVKTDMKFCIAPPLLVAFTEFTRRECKARKRPAAAVITVTACALAGAVCRMVFNMYFGLPLTVVAFVAVCMTLCIIYFTKLYLPPAGAMTILAMLIPEDRVILYSLQVFIGISVLMVLVLVLFRNDKSCY